MGIKQKDENSAGGLHNALAAGTTIKGNIITETDFRLDGKVEGDISCNGKIVIGPKGSVTGNIVSENAEILGEVDGSVKVSAKLILKSTAIIKGDIYTQSLEIEPNARFNGAMLDVFREKESGQIDWRAALFEYGPLVFLIFVQPLLSTRLSYYSGYQPVKAVPT